MKLLCLNSYYLLSFFLIIHIQMIKIISLIVNRIHRVSLVNSQISRSISVYKTYIIPTHLLRASIRAKKTIVLVSN